VQREPESQTRVVGALARGFLAGYGLLLALGAAFALRLRPGVEPLSGLSPERWLAVVAPCLALAGIAAVAGRGLVRRLAEPARAGAPGAAWLAAAAGLACVPLSLRIPDAHVSVLWLLAGPLCAALVWARASGRLEPLLAGAPLLLAALALFAVELPAGQSGEPSVRWGGPRTFATVFPRDEPFLGEGGRLRPDLELFMASAERLRGAQVRTDSHGFRNHREVALVPGEDELRILSLGDSFSVGMQIDQDAFLGPQLEAELASAGVAEPRVLNAEVSDPAYGLHYLQRHGLAFRPDLVLYGLCANDMLQAALRFGPDRLFRLDEAGRLQAFPDAPEPGGAAAFHHLVYPAVSPQAIGQAEPGRTRRAQAALSRRLRGGARELAGRLLRFRALAPLERDVVRTQPVPMWSYAREAERADGRMRLLDGTVNLAYFAVDPPPVLEEMYQKLFALLRAMDRSVREAGGRFVLVVHPQRFQVDPADWRALRDHWALSESDFDLERYNRRLGRFCRESGIDCLDLLPAFRREAGTRALYLPRGDMHYNRAGHALAARALAVFLRERGLTAPAPATARSARLTSAPRVGYVPGSGETRRD
jgi:lysophospholipase L1-like esterase